ncbi:MAG: nucleotide exchange factor GrpE [Desulfobacteraceae bacterium IS3]|nr:MAG: nucleotide exchange factor GrpE [Desulfobacteraceae bacterium IS3]
MNGEDKTRDQELSDKYHRLKEAMQDLEKRYQSLIETDLYGIQEIDIYGNITYMNSVQYQILGYEEGELRGTQIWDLLASDDDRNELTDYLTRIALGEYASFPWTGTYVRKDGKTEELQVDWKCRWGSDETVTGFVSVISDIVGARLPDTSEVTEDSAKTGEKPPADEKDKEADASASMELLSTYLKAEEGLSENFRLPSAQPADHSLNLKLSEIQEQVTALYQEFQSKLKYDAHKDRMIDKLHKELQEYKGDILKKYLRAIIMDIIQTIDNIRKLTSHYRSQAPSEQDPAKLLSLLESVPSDMEDLFYRQGINTFTCDKTIFDPARQRILKTIETSDMSKDKTVAEHSRPGYEWEGQIIRPEMVAVYICKTADKEN